MQKSTLLKKVMGMCVCAMFTLSTFTAYSQVEPNWEIVTPKYATHDVFVSAINVMDHGADPTGETDQSALFQRLLDVLGSRGNGRVNDEEGNKIGAQANRNGGILFVPEGKYLFDGRLIVPKGVTIRGEWEKPVKGQPIKGTIFKVTTGSGRDAEKTVTDEIRSFITLQPSAAVKDVNIWYPNQDPENIVPYSPAILLGASGYWGNDYALVSNVTLVNAYDGVIFSRQNGGGAPNCYGIYGTPLRRGIEIDNIAEIGRIDNVDFSPDYWAGSGLPGSPAFDGPHKKFIYENGTAVIMRRNDWSFICKVKAEGYNIGYRTDLSYNNDSGTGRPTAPNGHNYGMEFTNCKYGVYAAAIAGAGMMFYEYKFINCDFGFYFPGAGGGVVQILGCEFDAKKAALYAPANNNTRIFINQSTFNRGAVDIRSGLTSIMASDFNSEADHIILGFKAIATITGNKFKNNDPKITNLSSYECVINHDPIEGLTKLPHFPYKNQFEFKQKPDGNVFYLATEHGVSVDNNDNSAALQALLNKTKAEGGGLVFIPMGRYNFRNPITIPTGVELKGSMDTPSLPTGPGTVLEIYAGKDDEGGTPFVTMEPGSGIRGFSMNYPEQRVQLLTEPALNGGHVYKYPYTIRGNKDVYIVNIAFRASYHGIDLFTNKCDNYFVDYPAGHVFKTGIRVGGGTQGGHLYNAQFNQIAYGSGGETKFGAWPNSPDNDGDRDLYSNEHALAYAYCWNNLDFIVLEDCEDQVLYNNFDFGSNRGFVLAEKNGKGPSGICLGQGIDQGMNAFYIGAVGEKGFNFISTQIVTTAPGRPGDVLDEYKTNNRYFQTSADFTGKVTFFGADFWGQPQQISNEILSGTLELQTGNYDNPGQRAFASVAEGAEFRLIGSHVRNVGTLLTAGSAPRFYAQSSLLNSGNVNTSECGLWLHNLGLTGVATTANANFIDRTGWIATASVRNEDANNSLDGDVNTRWSTLSENQKPGQWFKVDMLKEHEFTGIILEAGNNSSLPATAKVYISDDDTNWEEVASGNNIGEFFFTSKKARYIKIEQTSSKSSSWRVAEFYITNLPDYSEDPIDPNTSIQIVNSEKKDVSVNISSSGFLNLYGTTGLSSVKVYSISGQQLLNTMIENSTNLNLPSGAYVVIIENNGKVYREKFIKR